MYSRTLVANAPDPLERRWRARDALNATDAAAAGHAADIEDEGLHGEIPLGVDESGLGIDADQCLKARLIRLRTVQV